MDESQEGFDHCLGGFEEEKMKARLAIGRNEERKTAGGYRYVFIHMVQLRTAHAPGGMATETSALATKCLWLQVLPSL